MRIEYAIGHVDGTIDGPFTSERDVKNRMQRADYSIGRTVTDAGRVGPWKDNDAYHGLCYAHPRFKPGFVYVPPPSKEELLDMFEGVSS